MLLPRFCEPITELKLKCIRSIKLLSIKIIRVQFFKEKMVTSSVVRGHMKIHYFFINDRVISGEVTIKYCPAGEMVANNSTKKVQGRLLSKFRYIVMNISEDTPE